MNLGKRKEVAIQACREVGTILRDNFGRKFQVHSKGDRDLVTDIDKKAEDAILRRVKKCFPEDGIISEESPAAVSRSGYSWIIDPIDGTHNFVHNIAIFGTSCALAFEKEVVLGIIYIPLSDELYAAEKGKGAYANGKKIIVSNRSLKEATLIYDSSIRYYKDEMLECLGRLAEEVFNIRMFGSTVRSLTYLAEGKAEMEIEFSDKVWDFAAGLLLVEEAGGKCTDFAGNPWSTETKRYLASNGVVHQDLLKIMNCSL